MQAKPAEKCLKLVVLTGMIALIMVLTAFAAYQPPDTDKTGSITVVMKTESDEAEQVVGGGEMTIYRVAGIYPDENGNYFFHILEDFQGSGVDLDGKTGDDLDGKWSSLARTLAEYISGYEEEGYGYTKPIGEDGVVYFDGLPVGLYLLTQTTPADGYYPVNPFLVSLPLYDEESGLYEYQVDATPKTEVQKIPETKPSETTPHHGGGGGSGGGGGGSNGGGPGSSGSSSESTQIWDLLPLPQTGQGWAMLAAVVVMIAAGIAALVTLYIKSKG